MITGYCNKCKVDVIDCFTDDKCFYCPHCDTKLGNIQREIQND